MLVLKSWARVKTLMGIETGRKEYHVLLLLVIIPIFIWING